MNITETEITKLYVSEIENNKGQITGVPKNPRTITRAAFAELCERLKKNNLTGVQPLKVFAHNGKYIVLGGNQRLRALKKIGIEQVPCIIVPADTPTEILREIVILDNENDGENDWDSLANEWEVEELEDWGVKLSSRPKARFGNSEVKALCNLKEDIVLHHSERNSVGGWVSAFRRSSEGQPLEEIKTPANVELFAYYAVRLLCDMVHLRSGDRWCIVTTPRRRHTDWHFATAICERMEELTGIVFYPDIVKAKNRGGIGATFELQREVEEENVIIYDDIRTTGSTMQATKELFPTQNVVQIVGIWNA